MIKSVFKLQKRSRLIDKSKHLSKGFKKSKKFFEYTLSFKDLKIHHINQNLSRYKRKYRMKTNGQTYMMDKDGPKEKGRKNKQTELPSRLLQLLLQDSKIALLQTREYYISCNQSQRSYQIFQEEKSSTAFLRVSQTWVPRLAITLQFQMHNCILVDVYLLNRCYTNRIHSNEGKTSLKQIETEVKIG